MLITQYAAAKQAGVTRQSIQDQKNKVPRPLYFVEMKVGWRIDDDHQLWKLYCQTIAVRKGTVGKEDRQKQEMIDIVAAAIKKVLNPDPEKLNELYTEIDRNLNG